MDFKTLSNLLDKGFNKYEICKILKICICDPKQFQKDEVFGSHIPPDCERKCSKCGGY